jgi:hypothetical protein
MYRTFSGTVLNQLQASLNNLCTHRSAAKLYLSPEEVGLGLLNMRGFPDCQQAVRVIRAHKAIRDSW